MFELRAWCLCSVHMMQIIFDQANFIWKTFNELHILFVTCFFFNFMPFFFQLLYWAIPEVNWVLLCARMSIFQIANCEPEAHQEKKKKKLSHIHLPLKHLLLKKYKKICEFHFNRWIVNESRSGNNIFLMCSFYFLFSLD